MCTVSLMSKNPTVEDFSQTIFQSLRDQKKAATTNKKARKPNLEQKNISSFLHLQLHRKNLFPNNKQGQYFHRPSNSRQQHQKEKRKKKKKNYKKK